MIETTVSDLAVAFLLAWALVLMAVWSTFGVLTWWRGRRLR